MSHGKILLLLLLLIESNCYGQSKMLCDQAYDGSISYGRAATNVKSISRLSKKIQNNLFGYLNQALGTIKDSAIFSHGQTINLRREFKKDTCVYRREWIVAKYDLSFVIHDISIGIKNYYLNIRMDKFGQIIYSNWPRHGYSDKKSLSQFHGIEHYALTLATKKKYNIDGYNVKLKYNEKLDVLWWTFYFVHKSDERLRSYNFISIDWNSGEAIIDDGMIFCK